MRVTIFGSGGSAAVRLIRLPDMAGLLLTWRRAVDLCRVESCLCRAR